MLEQLLRKKPIGHAHASSSLHRSLTTLDLILMGIGAIIGAGVFVLTGIAAATKAGPAVVFAYAIAGMAAMFAALAYAELASSVGGTGSAYGYAYAGFGELVAWVIGWNLVLEYLMSVATVAIGWSGYMQNLLESFGIHLPHDFITNPFDGGIVDLPALLITLAMACLLSLGVKQSARFNNAVVFIKLITIAVFIAVASMNVQPVHWEHFMPYGFDGVLQGASLVFFAYIGFDALSTATEEAIEPGRSIPIGIIASVAVCTIIYIVVSGLLTAIVPYYSLDLESPVSDALLSIGHATAAGLTAAGAVAGLTTVMLVMFYGLTRIILAITRDGLLPQAINHIHPRTHTPLRIIWVLGVIIAVIAGLSPIGHAAELVNIGTLAAFAFVCGGVVVLRTTQPDLPRPFRLPFSPFIPLLGMMSCIYLMYQLPGITWWRFAIWTLVGLFIYFAYSKRHSILNRDA